MKNTTTAIVGLNGRVTLPAYVRKALNLDGERQLVRFELCEDGSALMYPVRNALDLKGIFADPSRPYNPEEREKAWAAHSKEVVRKGRRQ